MTYLVFILTVLAFWHLVYEGVIAPTWRMSLRNELFACRDELRRLWMEKREDESEEPFVELERFLNNGIAFLHALRPSILHEFQELLRRNPALQEESARRNAAIDRHPAVAALQRRAVGTLNRTLAANSGGWLIWVAPIAVAFALTASFVRQITTVFSLPKEAVAALVDPQSDLAGA